jgi:uncharacterized membrane protein
MIKFNRVIFILIVLLSLLGLYVSIILTVDKIELAANPDLLLSCSINEVLDCATVMKTDQASLLGFPNSLLGIAGYGLILGFAGTSLFYKKQNKNLIKLALLGTFGAFLFSYWMLYQSSFVIGVLCPLCLLSCLASTNIFFGLIAITLRQYDKLGKFNLNWEKDSSKIIINYVCLVFFWHVLVFGMIYYKYGSMLFKW